MESRQERDLRWYLLGPPSLSLLLLHLLNLLRCELRLPIGLDQPESANREAKYVYFYPYILFRFYPPYRCRGGHDAGATPLLERNTSERETHLGAANAPRVECRPKGGPRHCKASVDESQMTEI